VAGPGRAVRRRTRHRRIGAHRGRAGTALRGTLTQMADCLGVPAKTVKIWHHAGLITGHPFNDKGECLYPPPGPNPPTRAQGRKLSERRPAHDA
jgi:hypothetical protein